jgi:alpha-L-fucosidase
MTTPSYDELTILDGPFTPAPESLRTFKCPDWFRDAKFGIWSHWGPQSVPMFGDWYARHLYVEGTDQYLHHWRVYGHPSKVGYKDIVKLWKAEKFDPDGLMSLYVDAGAKYFVGQAMHHDNFDNFDSAHNPWNSVNVGPHKDISRLWQKAARAKGLPFGLTEHLGASFNWFGVNKGADKAGPYAGVPYDGNDPEYSSLYHNNQGYSLEKGWYTDNDSFHRHWFHRIKDVIDKFQPDLLYSDGGVPFDEVGRRIIAHLYNTSIAAHGENRAVYNQKDKDPLIHTFGVFDIERSQREDISEYPWQTDTSIGDWFYNLKDKYKTPSHTTEMLVDIVSKNGNLLLNIPQRPDGTLDDECTFLLKEVGRWTKTNGDGIYGTRPWKSSGEGPSTVVIEHFREDAVPWTSDDYRFTEKGNTVYAFQMRPAENGTALIKKLASNVSRKVLSVRVLGGGNVDFQQTPAALNISGAHTEPLAGPRGFAIELE